MVEYTIKAHIVFITLFSGLYGDHYHTTNCTKKFYHTYGYIYDMIINVCIILYTYIFNGIYITTYYSGHK